MTDKKAAKSTGAMAPGALGMISFSAERRFTDECQRSSGKHRALAYLCVSCILTFSTVPVLAAGSATEQKAIACPEEVRIVYPDISAPPFMNGSGRKIPDDPGFVVNWAKAAMARSACHVKLIFDRVPVYRSILEINNGQYDILLVSATDNPLLTKLRYPMAGDNIDARKVIGKGALMLYTMPASSASWDGAKLTLPSPGTVGVVRGQVTGFLAKQNGWFIDESPDSTTNFRKLALGRVSAVLEQQLIASDIMKTVPNEHFQMLTVPVKTMSYYSPVTPVFYNKYPDFSEQFWLDMCEQSRTVLKDLPKCR